MNEPEFNSLIQGFRFTWKQWAVTVDLQRFHVNAHGAAAELTVLAQIRGQERILTQGVLNLSSFSARQQLAKRLQHLLDGPQWDTVVEASCIDGLREYRKGTPSSKLEPSDDDQPLWFVCNPLLYEQVPTLLYGPGESGKSMFALFVACLLASGGSGAGLAVAPDGHEVLYLDWELNKKIQAARVKQLQAGHPELTRVPWYRKMTLPLTASVADVQREVQERSINVLIIDSLGMATGGEMERASDPIAFFGALASLDCTSLLISHVAKPADEEKTRTPYGSVYYFNLSHSLFEMRLVAEPESDQRTLALYHRKNNSGRRLPALGFRLTISNDAARFESCDPTEEPELEANLPLPNRIRNLLEDGTPRTSKQIAEELGAKLPSIKAILSKHEGKKWSMLGGAGFEETTWCVLRSK